MCKALNYACLALTKTSPSREVLFLICRVGAKDVVTQQWCSWMPSRTEGIGFTQMLIKVCGEGQREESYKALT